jgi:ABC-type multidrug transport system fused ATPase/permease subunit
MYRMSQPSHSAKSATLQALVRLARPYQRRFLLIGLLALLGTAADLAQPLIYRVAINDVAGLFVERPAETSPLPSSATPGATEHHPAADEIKRVEQELERLGRTHLPHRRDYVAPRTRQQTLRTLLWAAFLLFLVSVTGYYVSLAADYQSTLAAADIEAGLIQSTFGHVLRLPLSFFTRRASGGLAKRIDQSDQVAPIVSAFAQEIAPAILRIVGICAIMLTQSWRLTLAAVAILPLYLFITARSAKRLESGMNEYYGLWETVSVRIQDALGAIKTVKLSGAEGRESTKLHEASRDAYGDYLERERLGNRYLFLQSTLSHLSKALVLGYGGWMVLNRRLTPGDVVMFVAYLDQLYDPIDSLSSIAVTLQQHFASVSRALRLLQTGPEEAGGAELAPGPGRVEFRDVHFGYGPQREVLSGLSFTAEAGLVLALTGPSGAGKTTAADLLMKLWEPQSGEILIDGQPLSGIDASSIRRAIGVVAADGAIFRGTLADNIRYKRPQASDEEVRMAALAAGMSRTLERLPDGLETEVGEGGLGLSVGERQRIQLARILVDQPRILVLDEATANLDYATESEVKRTLGSLTPQPTMIIIAHRYSMLKDADQVVVLDHGCVAEQGTPDELVGRRGWFSQLAERSADAHADGEAANGYTSAATV